MKLFAIRHGQTDWNVAGRMQGCTDIELNETGLAQAEAAAQTIGGHGISLIISSPLSRARKTAEILNRVLNCPIIVDDALRERGFGIYEGMLISEIRGMVKMDPEYFDKPGSPDSRSVEPMEALRKRVGRLLDDIRVRYPDETVLLVTHGGTMRAISSYFRGDKASAEAVAGNCQLTEFDFDDIPQTEKKENTMTLKELVIKSRSCRAYDESYRMTEQNLRELIELARFAPTSGNQQALKFYISWEKDEVDAIAKCTHWGKDKPYPGINPSAFVLIIQDTDIDKREWSWWREAGIAAQTILLGAAEKGLNGLMIGSYDNGPLRELVGLKENHKLLLVLAIGKGTESAVVEDLEPGDEKSVYRDENGVTHVKKRKLDELILKRA